MRRRSVSNPISTPVAEQTPEPQPSEPGCTGLRAPARANDRGLNRQTELDAADDGQIILDETASSLRLGISVQQRSTACGRNRLRRPVQSRRRFRWRTTVIRRSGCDTGRSVLLGGLCRPQHPAADRQHAALDAACFRRPIWPRNRRSSQHDEIAAMCGSLPGCFRHSMIEAGRCPRQDRTASPEPSALPAWKADSRIRSHVRAGSTRVVSLGGGAECGQFDAGPPRQSLSATADQSARWSARWPRRRGDLDELQTVS